MSEVTNKRMTRRDLVRGAIGASLIGATGTAAAQGTEDKITPADIAVADRLAGRRYSEAERALMTRSAPRLRDNLRALRQAELDGTVEPATRFDPRLPGMSIPRRTGGCRL